MKQPKTANNVVIEYTDWTQFLPWVTQIAFVVAVALVIARMLMMESIHEPLSSLESTTLAPRGCGPAGSVFLDLACCIPALLVLFRRAVDKTYIVRFTIAEALLGAFALWALLSPLWAANKAQALILSFHLVAAAAMFWAMGQLVRSWGRLRIVAAVCLGVLLVYIAQGLMYRFSDLPQTIDYWKAHRSEEMQAHGWQEGDFELQQYEQKLLHGEMVGFTASPNTLAAAMVFMSIVVVGVGIQRIVNKDDSGMIGATLLALPLAGWIVYFTHSNAAFVSPVIAAIILVGVWKLDGLLNRKRKLAYLVGVGVVLLGTCALVGHGLFHGSLPTASLNFRWRYWVASMRMFKLHPLRGVGYGNFGDAYLGVRLPAAAEEVKDPHNFIVRAATELGIVGAILMIAWLARAWWEWTAPRMPASSVAATRSKFAQHSTRAMFLTILSIPLLGVIVKLAAGTDFSADANWVRLELLQHLVYWALLLIGMAVIVVQSTKQTVLDDRPAPWVLWAMLAGLAVFFIHNLIDFSFFEVGPMMLCVTIGGAVLGVRSPSAAGAKKRTPIAIASFACLLMLWLVALILVAVPLAQAEGRAYRGDQAFRQGLKTHAEADFRLAAEHYQAAFITAPAKDPDYAMRAARALMYVPSADGAVRANLGLSIAANPNDPMGYLTRARYNVHQHPDERADIKRDYERALELNPNDIDTRLEYAKLLEEYGEAEHARDEYRAALATNAGFDATEPKRLAEERVKEIEAKLKG